MRFEGNWCGLKDLKNQIVESGGAHLIGSAPVVVKRSGGSASKASVRSSTPIPISLNLQPVASRSNSHLAA